VEGVRAPLIFFGVSTIAAATSVVMDQQFHALRNNSFDRVATFLIGGAGGLDQNRVWTWGVFVATITLAIAFGLAIRAAWRDGFRQWAVVAGFSVAAELFFGGTLVFVGLLVLGAYTEVEGDTHGRDLVVREWSFLLAGGGTVFERDGIWLTNLGTISTDDGYTPVSQGEYRIRPDVDAVVLEFPFEWGKPFTQQLVIPDGTQPEDGAFSEPIAPQE
jgi:hypothetical protein